MKNGEVLTLYETLERISKNKDLKFNVKLGYAIAKNKQKLQQEAVIIYDQRRKIIMEYGEVDGSDIRVPKEFVDEVNKKINELMDIENDVEVIKVPLEAFGDQKLNIEDMEGLMGMLFEVIFTGPPILEKTGE